MRQSAQKNETSATNSVLLGKHPMTRATVWCKHIYALRNGTKSSALDGNGSACHSWIHKHAALLYIHATGAANNLLVALNFLHGMPEQISPLPTSRQADVTVAR